MKLKLPSRKALLQQKAIKQRRLDAAVAVQPLLGDTAPRRSVAPSTIAVSFSQPLVSDTVPPSTPAKRSSRLRTSSRHVYSQVAGLPASVRFVQRPVIKKFERCKERRAIVHRRRRPSAFIRQMIERGQKDLETLKALVQQDVTLVSVDTEFERRGVMNRVVEIGLSTLDVRDVFSRNVAPGRYADNWISHMNHDHIIVSDAKFTEQRRRGSRFGWSTLLSAADARNKVLRILKSLEPSSNGTRRIALVGHSLLGDLNMLRRTPDLCLDLTDSRETGAEVVASFDTHLLALSLAHSGVRIPSFTLSSVALAMGINPKYISRKNGHLLGWHNASNDAAYTLMVLLLCVARQQSVTETCDIRPQPRPLAIAIQRWQRQLGAFFRYLVGQ